MAGSTSSTDLDEIRKASRLSRHPGWMSLRDVPAVDAIPNELASTDRYWAAKPPPGMESDPLDWDEITQL